MTPLHLAILSDDHEMVCLIIHTDYFDDGNIQAENGIVSDDDTSNHSSSVSSSLNTALDVIITGRCDTVDAPDEDVPVPLTEEELLVQKCESKSSVDSDFLILFDTDEEETASACLIPSYSEEEEVENTSNNSTATSSESNHEEKYLSPLYCHDLEESQSISVQLSDTQEGMIHSSPRHPSDESHLNIHCPTHECKDRVIEYDNPVISSKEDRPEAENKFEE